MAGERYPNEYWEAVKDLWMSDLKTDLKNASEKIAKDMGLKAPSPSSVTRKAKTGNWTREESKDLVKLNAKKLNEKLREIKKGGESSSKSLKNKETQKDVNQKTANANANTHNANANSDNANSSNASANDSAVLVDEGEYIEADQAEHIEGEFVPKGGARKGRNIGKRADLRAALIIKANRYLAHDLRVLSQESIEALQLIKDEVLHAQGEEEVEIAVAKLYALIKVINATYTISKSFETTAKVEAVYWGLGVDDLKDVAEQTARRTAHAEQSQALLEAAKQEMLNKKKLAFQRKLEIIEMGDDFE